MTQQDKDQQRTAFEAWHNKQYISTDPLEWLDGGYVDFDHNRAWKAWQAAIAHARQQRGEVVAWQPIETAPKDGRTLLLGRFNSHGKWRTMRGQWMGDDYIAEHWEDPDSGAPGWFETAVEAEDIPNCWPIEPTHWQPLPAAPQPAEPAETEVDAHIRVLEALDTWVIEDWNELLERNPSIFAMIKTLVAEPVKGEPSDEQMSFDDWWEREMRNANSRGPGDDWLDLNPIQKENYRACWEDAQESYQGAQPAAKVEWISTSERLPDAYKEVYAKHKDGTYRVARLSKSEGGCWQLATFLIGTKRPGYAWAPEDVVAWCPIVMPAASAEPVDLDSAISQECVSDLNEGQKRLYFSGFRQGWIKRGRDAQPAASAEPVFWYRPVGKDGGCEGPIHDGAIEDVRKRSGAWVPLFAGAAPVAAQPSIPEIPDGWKLVPVEPTRSMMAAAVIFANGNAVYKNVAAKALEIEESIYGEAYKAMLEAAPTPPADGQPIIPPQLDYSTLDQRYVTGWNDCRAAMFGNSSFADGQTQQDTDTAMPRPLGTMQRGQP